MQKDGVIIVVSVVIVVVSVVVVAIDFVILHPSWTNSSWETSGRDSCNPSHRVGAL